MQLGRAPHLQPHSRRPTALAALAWRMVSSVSESDQRMGAAAPQ
ncbi:hypothetical protein GGQ86_002525 [Xanthobacter flavus]|uniref:Uncharacterized protein n=1 Tax=Xanthobacter flavus TaxID=281 RepID=A0ABU1KHT9_XANFL|nr:hypothetical protein [Xanthobacter flavus]MDR6334049.1 hypothetical protein [Xanthobacter flavus]